MKRKKIATAITLALSLSYNSAFAQFDPVLELSNLNGQNGFVINGEASNDYSGQSVAAAGDVNGDGLDDLIIGASGRNSFAGSSYVVFGSDNGLPNPFNLSSINNLNGFDINGVAQGDEFGGSVSSAGDVNGDGVDDLIFGASRADPNGIDSGSSYVVFGSDTGIPNPFDLTTLDGTNGFTINGLAAFDRFGRSVSKAGDVNGDGIDDLVIGASQADSNGNDRAGSTYVVFGSDSGIPHPFNLSTLDGTNGFTINGVAESDFSGVSVSTAGDFNGDGIDDLIIGASNAESNGNDRAGRTYVVFGSDSGLPSNFNLSSLNSVNGFTIYGVAERDESGSSVSTAGDINGDGLDDLIIGARYAEADIDQIFDTQEGRSYVLFGSSTPLPNPFNLSSLNGVRGFTINGVASFDRSGHSVSAAGDINGDGIDDLIIGAPLASRNNNAYDGNSYVVFGKSDIIFKNGFE